VSFSLKNNLSSPVILVPMSDMKLQVVWKSLQIKELDQPNLYKETARSNYFTAGKLYELRAGEEVNVFVSMPSPAAVTPEQWKDLLTRRPYKHHGCLFFERVSTRDVNFSPCSPSTCCVQVIDIHCVYGLSTMTVSPKIIRFGKMGHVNSWQKERIQVTVCNPSEMPLAYMFSKNSYLTILSCDKFGDQVFPLDQTLYLEANCSADFTVELDPKKLQSESRFTFETALELLDLNDTSTIYRLPVHAQLTLFDLKFGRIGAEKEIVLPPLFYPTPSFSRPCETWFTFRNIRDLPFVSSGETSLEDNFILNSVYTSQFSITPVLEEVVQGFVFLELYSRYSNAPLPKEISLGSLEVVEARVRLSLLPELRLPQRLLDYLVSDHPVLVGQLCFRSLADREPLPPEIVRVYARIVEGPTFSILPKSIQLSSLSSYPSDFGTDHTDDAQQEIRPKFPSTSKQFLILNLSNEISLSFRVKLRAPSDRECDEENALLCVLPECGVIAPGNSQRIEVRLRRARVTTSCTLKIDIIDLFARQGIAQRSLTVKILSGSNLALDQVQKKQQPFPVTSNRSPSFPLEQCIEGDQLPFLWVRCRNSKPIINHLLIEVNIGQQTYKTGPRQREILIENGSLQHTISYRVRPALGCCST
jgi:hypothetical protein